MMWRALIPLLLIAAAPADTLTIGGVAFPQSDFLDARAIFDETGMPVIYVTLSPSGRAKLAKITQANVGKELPLLIGSRVLTKPVVREPILGGTLQISGMASVEEAKALAKAISGKDPLPESLEE
jgi:preprotein translocase subunit SecD